MNNSYLINPDTGNIYNSDDFNLTKYLTELVPNPKLLQSREWRIEATRTNPLLFALIYCPQLMRSEETGEQLTINDVNLILAHYALEWATKKDTPKRPGLRRAFLCPRSSSKTTSIQMYLLWAIAHRHIRYGFIFCESDTTAEINLADLKREIFTNPLIKADYNGLTQPARLIAKKVPEGDTKNLYRSQSGITLESRSIHSTVLGSKRDGKRPDLLWIDDSSKGEGVGSIHRSIKQLDIILDSILPMNDCAPVMITGTNHYVGSTEDCLIRSLNGEDFPWIKEENIQVHHVLPLVHRPDGTLRSIWKERWTVDWLIQHSSDYTYKRDFLNQPTPKHSSIGWTDEDFVLGTLPSLVSTIISVDPGLSEHGDPTGIAVIGFSIAARKAILLEVTAVQLKAVALKQKMLELVELYDPDIVLYESNQGGEMLAQATLGADFPLPIKYTHAKESKVIRAELLLTRYRRKQILHAKKFPSYEAECRSFPTFARSPNQVDAVGQGIEWLAKNSTVQQSLKVGAR